MKRIELWRAKLKAAKSEAKHKQRQATAAARSYNRTFKEIEKLEGQINDFMAKTKQ
jgi:hypothetical protein